MLNYVQPGDDITAEGYNELVDAVGGVDCPSDNFYKTNKGSII